MVRFFLSLESKHPIKNKVVFVPKTKSDQISLYLHSKYMVCVWCNLEINEYSPG